MGTSRWSLCQQSSTHHSTNLRLRTSVQQVASRAVQAGLMSWAAAQESGGLQASVHGLHSEKRWLQLRPV